VVDCGWISRHSTLARINLEQPNDHRQISKPRHPKPCEVTDDAVAHSEYTPAGNDYIEDLLVAHRINYQVLVDVYQNLHVNRRLRHRVGVRVASNVFDGVEVVDWLRVRDVEQFVKLVTFWDEAFTRQRDLSGGRLLHTEGDPLEVGLVGASGDVLLIQVYALVVYQEENLPAV